MESSSPKPRVVISPIIYAFVGIVIALLSIAVIAVRGKFYRK